jgi:transcription antitermination factor NusG
VQLNRQTCALISIWNKEKLTWQSPTFVETCMEHWYTLRTKPNREELVQVQLGARHIESYLPRWQPPYLRNTSQKRHPFFPSYLFARVDLQVVAVSTLAYLPGVSRLLMYDGVPIRVEQAAIDEIRTRIQLMEDITVDAMGRPLRYGDKVLILGGVFAGYEAIFDRRLSSGDRVQILIDFLQTRAPLQIQRNQVQKQMRSNDSDSCSAKSPEQ